MSKRERNRRQRVRRLSKRLGIATDLAASIESAQRNIAGWPTWMRNTAFFAGSEAATGHHCEDNP